MATEFKRETALDRIQKLPAGTRYLSILPVDQGIEHSAEASFAPNPKYLDPENTLRLAIKGGSNAHKYAHKIPFIVKINHNNCCMGRCGLINSGGDRNVRLTTLNPVRIAVINERGEGIGLISSSSSFSVSDA